MTGDGLLEVWRRTTLVRGINPRGVRHWGAASRHQTCMRQVRLDPNHDAVMRIGGEAPGGGPILSVGIKRQVRIRFPATSDRQFGSRAESRASAENGAKWYARSGKLLSGRWTQDDAVQ